MSRDPKFASIGLVEVGEELARSRAGNDPVSGGLVGQFFHSESDPGWQGRVVAKPETGMYLVALFSWLDGNETKRVLVPFDDMVGWRFYETADDMAFAYEYGGVKQVWDREREER